jgi:hypothetical protein
MEVNRGDGYAPEVFGKMPDQMRQILLQLLIEHGMPRPMAATDVQSVLETLGPMSRCGIYLLIFPTGEIYIGQSIRAQKRFQEHVKKYLNISGFSFMKIKKQELSNVEEAMIKRFESEGFLLRNFTYASRPSRPSTFDDVVSQELQSRFLCCTELGSVGPEKRNSYHELRRKAEFNFKKLRQNKQFRLLYSLVETYGKVALPNPAETEVGYWCVTALPSTRDKVLFRFNIYRQEVMNCGHDEQGWYMNFYLAKTVLERDWGKTFAKHHFPLGVLEFSDNTYKPGGFDQVNVIINGLEHAKEFMSNLTVIEAIRKFNLALMRKGPNAWPQNHCPQLADAIFETNHSLAVTERGLACKHG